MKNITAQIAAIATLALAALPAAALSTAARAEAPHAQASVRIADLNLSSPADQAVFAQRTRQAARDFCADRQLLSAKGACETAVRVEVEERLAAMAKQATTRMARN